MPPPADAHRLQALALAIDARTETGNPVSGNGKSGVRKREIRCQDILARKDGEIRCQDILARKDEPTSDYADGSSVSP